MQRSPRWSRFCVSSTGCMAELAMGLQKTPQSVRTRQALARLAALADAAPDVCGWRGPMIRVMGLDLPGRVGLAAGFDRQGTLLGTAHRLGFGSVELGTFVGNEAHGAWCVDARATMLRRAACGISIGKHPSTPWTHAEDDYLDGLHAAHACAHYLTLNPGRDRPTAARFSELVATVAAARDKKVRGASGRLPIVVKVPAAWLEDRNGVRTASMFVAHGADGLLISAEEASTSTAAVDTLRTVADALPRDVCLISVGGIDSVREAMARRHAGADLIHLHRGVCKQGPCLVETLNRALSSAAQGPNRVCGRPRE